MSFHLVQRLEAAPDGRHRQFISSDPRVRDALLGAGAEVSLAYMGKAEFEIGAAARSNHRIISTAGRLRVVAQTLLRPNYVEPVYFVCTAEQVKTALPAWHAWVSNPDSLEPTGYFRDIAEDNIGPKDTEATVGWWDLREDLIWTREVAVAEKVLGAFVTLAATS